jgi:integrase
VLTSELHRRDTGIDINPAKMTVSEFLARWLRDYARPHVAPSTLSRYTQIAGRLSHLLGTLPLQGLRPSHIQDAYGRLSADGLAARTVLHHHRVLREALMHAVRWQLLAVNPADGVTPPRPERTEMRALDPVEVGHLLYGCDDPELRTISFTAVATGMRLGELLGLKWGDVDLEGQTAYLVRSVQYLTETGVSFRPMKSAKSRRSIALSAETVRVLREHRGRQIEARLAVGPGYEDNDLVFADTGGHPIAPYSVSGRFRRLARRLGLYPLRFHDLRHTAATLMLRADVHPKVVSERLGHSSIAITLDTYSHVIPSMQRDAADAIDALLFRTP